MNLLLASVLLLTPVEAAGGTGHFACNLLVPRVRGCPAAFRRPRRGAAP
jgi:hypothetical protein